MKVIKRDGRAVDFDREKIVMAISKAMAETKQGVDEMLAQVIADDIEFMTSEITFVKVEEIQKLVENFLMDRNKEAAKAFILYRNTRSKVRKPNVDRLLDDEFISKYKHLLSNMSPLGEFVYYRTYSRYLPEEGRREYWWETCRRAVEYNCSIVPTTKAEAQELFDNMFHMRQFLSGRTIWVGGTKVSKNHPMANFNCAFQTVDSVESFSELLYLLMLGSGVGVRILKDDVAQIPAIRSNVGLYHMIYRPLRSDARHEHTSLIVEKTLAIISVGDSKNGWVDALKYYFSILSEPHFRDISDISINYNSVRPSGERLKTFGGTASGHDALKDIFQKIHDLLKRHDEEISFKLLPIDCLDICNIIGEGVVVGGVRRTAEIVLFDSDDDLCIKAKSKLYKETDGKWSINPKLSHRQMSNNSIFYQTKPTREKLHWHMEQMRYSGEPAFVNEEAAMKRRPNFKGVNPCAEILLDSKGMCNLTTVNVMAFVDEAGRLDEDALLKAQALSARAGYRMTCLELELPRWNATQKRDRLTGCSLTGWQDMVNATHLTKDGERRLLRRLREVARTEANAYARHLGMKEPLLVTTIKPEGTISQLPVVSSGIHHSHDSFYIRRIRVNAKDPILKVCEELEWDIRPENGQTEENCKTKVVAFPVKAPVGKTKRDVSAIEQLENYRMFMQEYIDHNCSITVHVRDHEWEAVEQWLWDNWDDVVAVSFLALNDNFYDQLPYESITEAEYESMVSKSKPFVPSLISKYEVCEEEFELTEDPACASGACPIR